MKKNVLRDISSDHRQLSLEHISSLSGRTKLSSSSLMIYAYMLLCRRGEPGQYRSDCGRRIPIDLLRVLDGFTHMLIILECIVHMHANCQNLYNDITINWVKHLSSF